MIGATRSQMRQLLRISRVDEPQHFLAAAVIPNHSLPPGNPPTDKREYVYRQFVLIRERCCSCAPKESISLLFHVLHHELAQLIDNCQSIGIALPLRVTPGEQPMPAQDNSIASLACVDPLPQHHRQFESRPLPRKPDQPVLKS